ncbi:MAG: DUF29 domain-containing protein [Cyanobacteriota bacterium]
MGAELRKIDKTLYDMDYNLWVLETVSQLQRRDLEVLDWENLIEEVIDLSRRDKHKLESLLMRLLEHLLKLGYWNSAREQNQGHWQGEIRNFRKQIKRLLRDSPSLWVYLQDIFPECYQDSREIVSDRSQLSLEHFPPAPIGSLEQVLDEAWFPEIPED